MLKDRLGKVGPTDHHAMRITQHWQRAPGGSADDLVFHWTMHPPSGYEYSEPDLLNIAKTIATYLRGSGGDQEPKRDH